MAPKTILQYRGITILSCIGKVFTKLMADRLTAYLESKRLLSEEQGGFRSKRSCVDQIQVLEAVLTERRNTKQHTYLFFLDVKKAFDTVWRDGLWVRLWDCDVRGKMWRMLRAVYSSVQSSVSVGEEHTRWFDIKQGVRQGDSMSPILFAVFIDEQGVAPPASACNLATSFRHCCSPTTWSWLLLL